MDHSSSHNKEQNQLKPFYLIIAGLLAALIFQFFYFSNKVTAVKKISASETALSGNNPFPSPFSRNVRQRNSSANLPSSAFPGTNQLFDEDPFEALDRIHSRLNNMMNTARTYAPIMMQQMNRDLSSDFIPAVDMEENDKAYIVRADIPGLEKDKINITAENGVLIIQGTRETQTQNNDPNGSFTSERRYGSFARTVALPGPVDEAGIKADYKNGVLTVEVPKEKNSQTPSKRIPVQ